MDTPPLPSPIVGGMALEPGRAYLLKAKRHVPKEDVEKVLQYFGELGVTVAILWVDEDDDITVIPDPHA